MSDDPGPAIAADLAAAIERAAAALDGATVLRTGHAYEAAVVGVAVPPGDLPPAGLSWPAG